MEKYPSYINGTWINGSEWLTVMNPATGQPIAKVAIVGRKTVQHALECAQESYQQWRG